MKCLNIYLFVVLVLACLYATPVLSHKLNAAETTIKQNPRTDSIEIVHRFYLHDVNHLMQALGKTKTGTVNDDDKYQAFTQYIIENLNISFNTTQNIPLTFVGSELENKYFYIYQEFKDTSSSDSALRLSADINKMKTSWKPNYWLFQLEIGQKELQSFVLDKQTYNFSTVID